MDRSSLHRLVALLAPLVACTPQTEEVTLSIFAASSLNEAFEDLEHAFEKEHPGVDVELVFAGSQVLRLQIEQGAAADVFASADAQPMRALRDAELVSAPEDFASNELVVVVPRSNPAGIGSWDELPDASRLVIGTEAVPIGHYTRRVLDRAGSDFAEKVRNNVASEESNVRLVRAKVELGEADAAIVYRTDAQSSDAVVTLPIPAEVNLWARYPIATVTASTHAREASAFVDFVTSGEGQRILQRHGFLAP